MHQATDYQPAIEEMMKAQKAFLGDANDTPSYDILLHLMNMDALQYFGGMMGALEHHTSTTVAFVDAMGAGVDPKFGRCGLPRVFSYADPFKCAFRRDSQL